MENLSRQQIRNLSFVIDLAVFLILLIAFKLNWIISLIIAEGAGWVFRSGLANMNAERLWDAKWRRRFWLLWVVASAVGGACGSILIWNIGDAVGSAFGQFAFYIVLAALVGSMVGTMQWLVLVRRVSQAGWWLLASIVGWVVSEGLVGVGGLPIVLFVVGVTVGTLQWLLLRRQVSRAGWWVLASTVGWGMGVVVLVGAELLGGISITRYYDWVLSWLGIGAVFGAITGGVLAWLLRQTTPEAEEEPGAGKQ